MTDALPMFIKTVAGLAPANDAARDSLAGVPVGGRVKAMVSRPRNPAHHDKYWALIAKIAESTGRRKEVVHFAVKLRAGYVTWVELKDGVYPREESIAWSKMDQAAFAKFYDDALLAICQDFLPNLKPSQLLKQIEEMIAA